MTKDRVLIVDDETAIRASLQGILEDEGYAVQTAETGEEGLELLGKGSFGLVLLDIWLPKMSGLDVLAEIRRVEDRPEVVVISGHGTVETAVRATKLGAFDFLEKPLSYEKVVLAVGNALRHRKLEEENVDLRRGLQARRHLVGRSAAIQKLRAEIRKAAPTDGRVLITGEHGTGKELVARTLHARSRRRDGRFVEINCAAIPDDLIEAELFGHIRGGSANAVKDKKGKMLLADGGTLFLDEVGDMSFKTQAKLVKAVAEGKFEPLGAEETVAFDTRVIAASSRGLKELIGRGRFREDLFFRLNIIPLHIPPLRERTEDIPLLLAYFLRLYAAEYGKKPKTVHPEALRAFQNYPWPGNVSELMNVVERFVILVEEPEIGPGHLNLLVETRERDAAGPAGSETLEEAVSRFERRLLQRTLIRHAWNAARAAEELGVSPETLAEKVRAYQISILD